MIKRIMNRQLNGGLPVKTLLLILFLSGAVAVGVGLVGGRSAAGSLQAPCVVVSSGDGFRNMSFANQTGTFTAEFDATPSVSPINSFVALSNGAQNAFTGFAVLVRFNPSGNVDARNGGAFAAASTIPYRAGQRHHFRVVVNVPARTYSVFVSQDGGAEKTVGNNFSFRSEQSGVTRLNNWAVWVRPTPVGTNTVCNFVGGQQNVPPTITTQPTNQTVAAGQSVTFRIVASGSAPLSFQWQKNGVDIAGATSPTLTFTATAADNGAQFRCNVTNAFGRATSNSATLTISTNDNGPTAAELLAKVRNCNRIGGPYKTDEDVSTANISVCQANGAVFWKADMDIDCDGVRTAQCNENTDPAFQPDTFVHTSTDRPLNAAQLPYMVIPSPSSRWDYRRFNIQPGAVVAVIFNNKVEYAVFGDTGPVEIIGEASYKTASDLGIDPDPATGGTDSGVTYIIFQGSRVSPVEDHNRAVTLGRQVARQFVNNN